MPADNINSKALKTGMNFFKCPLLLFIGYIAKSMDPGQTLIRVHSVCYHDKIILKCFRVCAADVILISRRNLQDKKLLASCRLLSCLLIVLGGLYCKQYGIRLGAV